MRSCSSPAPLRAGTIFRLACCTLLFAASLGLGGCPEGAAEISLSPTELDFGEVALGDSADLQVTVSNTGAGPATLVFQVDDSGPFDVALSGAIEVSDGDSRIVFVRAQPTALGTATGVLAVLWGDERQEVSLLVTGIIGGNPDEDEDGFNASVDCDDTDPAINPDATEVCDGIDNNCSGTIDDDVDGDGDGSFACFDCDDDDGENSPDLDEVCDGLDNDCDEVVDNGFDEDDDGFTTCDDAPDCDDDDPNVSPDAPELCNGLDDDCDDAIDEDFTGLEDDVDQDGEPGCTDCDDEDPSALHGGVEVCDGADNNCDGAVDENGVDGDGDGATDCTDCDDADDTAFPGNTEVCDGVDNDCSGGIDEDVCGTDADGDGVNLEDGDCDDNDATSYPGAPELCDAADNDCDLDSDEGFDVDGDGVTTCGADGVAATADDDCDDTNAAVFPGNPELCDGLDNDCDGLAESLDDSDLDGVTTCDGDCDDGDDAVFPAAPELCDGLDNDCDLALGPDEVDGDGDGVMVCASDCDDADDANFPGNTEVCDGEDNDCNDFADVVATGVLGIDYALSTSDDVDGPAYNWRPEVWFSYAPSDGSALPQNLDGHLQGFQFDFYGRSVETFSFAADGAVWIGNRNPLMGPAPPIPAPGGEDNFIAIWWEDLAPSLAPSNPTVGFSDNSGERVLTHSFIQVPHALASGVVSAQIQFHEDSNNIEIHYAYAEDDSDPFGISIGVENEDGTRGTAAYSQEADLVLEDFVVRFTPVEQPEVDVDGDGQLGCDECDDTDPDVFVGATEVCNGVDDDCDGQIDESPAQCE